MTDIVFVTSIVSTNGRTVRGIGPYQLAWYLREHGYSAQIIDFAHLLDEDTLFQLLDKFITPTTKLLGWSQMGFAKSQANHNVERFCENYIPKIKQRYPQVTLITGGSSVHDVNYLYKNKTAFEYFFYGHAEDTMLAFMNHLYKGGPMPKVDQLYGNDVIRETAAQGLVERFNIENCHFRWHEHDCVQPGESLPLEIARGCIFKCKFCRYPYIGKPKNDFTKGIDNLMDELTYNYEKYGTTNYYMLSDTFNDDHERITMLREAMQRLPFKINYACYIRPDLLYSHPQQAEELEETGMVSCFFGIETFNEHAARIVGKPWSAKYAKPFMKRLLDEVWKDRVTFRASMIVGLPGDSRDMILRDDQWLADNGIPNWKWHPLNINRDLTGPWVSEFDRNAESYGYKWKTRYGKTVWYNEHWKDAHEVSRFTTKIASRNKAIQKPDCWNLMERGTHGDDVHVLKNQFVVVLGHNSNLEQRRLDFVTKYWNDLLLI